MQWALTASLQPPLTPSCPDAAWNDDLVTYQYYGKGATPLLLSHTTVRLDSRVWCGLLQNEWKHSQFSAVLIGEPSNNQWGRTLPVPPMHYYYCSAVC